MLHKGRELFDDEDISSGMSNLVENLLRKHKSNEENASEEVVKESVLDLSSEEIYDQPSFFAELDELVSTAYAKCGEHKKKKKPIFGMTPPSFQLLSDSLVSPVESVPICDHKVDDTPLADLNLGAKDDSIMQIKLNSKKGVAGKRQKRSVDKPISEMTPPSSPLSTQPLITPVESVPSCDLGDKDDATKTVQDMIPYFFDILETEMKHAEVTSLDYFDLVFFPVFNSNEHYIFCINHMTRFLDIIDIVFVGKRVSLNYKYSLCPKFVIEFFSRFMKKHWPQFSKNVSRYKITSLELKWQSFIKDTDAGLLMMKHMESYVGQKDSEWDIGLQVDNVDALNKLRIDYCWQMITNKQHKEYDSVIKKSKKFGK
ncbi:hypothetical protein M5689_011083 [Euphorbia peplus]|nr:hypothetical protein M5689_011083 [Euphorbia peplus]